MLTSTQRDRQGERERVEMLPQTAVKVTSDVTWKIKRTRRSGFSKVT